LPTQPSVFVEPFAGGAIIGLTVAAEGLADHVILVELDDDVASVWRTIIDGDDQWLARRISQFDLTPQTVEELLQRPHLSERENAFRTIVRNRVNHGGILAPGAGMLKNGEKGKGIGSRWYPDTLRSRIERIARFRDRITFIHGDGVEVLRQYSEQQDAVSFIDPPYTNGGKKPGTRLYTHSRMDHEQLFKTVDSLAGDFLMTYCNEPQVRKLARRHGFDVQPVAMKSTHHVKTEELLIGRDLDWVR
jgi:DNA adenine methylase